MQDICPTKARACGRSMVSVDAVRQRGAGTSSEKAGQVCFGQEKNNLQRATGQYRLDDMGGEKGKGGLDRDIQDAERVQQRQEK